MSLRLELDREMERKFRELAMHEFGYRKGALKEAGKIAISKWMSDIEYPPESRFKKSFIESVKKAQKSKGRTFNTKKELKEFLEGLKR